MTKLRMTAIAIAIALFAPTGALAKTFTVDVGPPGKLPAHLDLGAFFPSTLTVHTGDSVRFQIMGLHDVAYVPPRMARPALVIPDPGATAAMWATRPARRSGSMPRPGLS